VSLKFNYFKLIHYFPAQFLPYVEIMIFPTMNVHTLYKLLTPEVKRKGEVGKEDVKLQYSLTQTQPCPSFLLTKQGKNAVDTGTAVAYASRWASIHKFCVLLGRYKCALIVDRVKCPDHPPPLDPETIMLYMSYQSFHKGQVLTDRMTGVPVLDVNDKKVYCEGAWNCGSNLDKFRASIIALYSLYPDLRGAFVPECKNCVEKTTFNGTEATYTSCAFHTAGARVRTMGNSYEDVDVEKHAKSMKDLLSDYVIRGNIQLMPSEVRRLRTILLSGNSLSGLQFWVMIILGIKMYL
jgi:hypothetical protein